MRSDALGFPSGGIWCISVELSEDDFTRFASHSSCRVLSCSGWCVGGGRGWIRRVGVTNAVPQESVFIAVGCQILPYALGVRHRECGFELVGRVAYKMK